MADAKLMSYTCHFNYSPPKHITLLANAMSSSASRSPSLTPPVDLDTKPDVGARTAIDAPVTPPKGRKAATGKAGVKRKSPAKRKNDTSGSSEDSKPDVSSDNEDKPSPAKKGKGGAKKAAASKEPTGEFTQEKKDQLTAAVFMAGLPHIDKKAQATKVGLRFTNSAR